MVKLTIFFLGDIPFIMSAEAATNLRISMIVNVE
jgi:hypothetical protein